MGGWTGGRIEREWEQRAPRADGMKLRAASGTSLLQQSGTSALRQVIAGTIRRNAPTPLGLCSCCATPVEPGSGGERPTLSDDMGPATVEKSRLQPYLARLALPTLLAAPHPPSNYLCVGTSVLAHSCFRICVCGRCKPTDFRMESTTRGASANSPSRQENCTKPRVSLSLPTAQLHRFLSLWERAFTAGRGGGRSSDHDDPSRLPSHPPPNQTSPAALLGDRSGESATMR